jgi:putative addiction module killer protein
MFRVLQTDVFSKWLSRLRDARAKARIVARVDALRIGHFGDVKHLGGGVAEMRIDVGAGYRVYFVRRQSAVVILLCGGDKSTQDKDIARARTMATDLD